MWARMHARMQCACVRTCTSACMVCLSVEWVGELGMFYRWFLTLKCLIRRTRWDKGALLRCPNNQSSFEFTLIWIFKDFFFGEIGRKFEVNAEQILNLLGVAKTGYVFCYTSLLVIVILSIVIILLGQSTCHIFMQKKSNWYQQVFFSCGVF